MADKLDRNSQPVLLLNGEFDSPEFLDASTDLADRLRISRSVTIAGADGFPSWEGPLEVNQAAAEFLASVSSGAPS
jgi:pimeloyl-ACP methyl ester carboxylesterase